MNDIELSVIIPVYNTEKYIERCLESVVSAVKKSKVKSEIIVVNDGSQDNSEIIINKFLKKYSNLIKYYKKENAGLADTKNFGIRHSSGKYLSFVDSDDFIDEYFYYDTLEIINKENVDLLICDWETVDEENNKKYIVEAKNMQYEDDKWGCIDVPIMPSSCNKIVKRELFINLEFPVGLRYEDLGTTLVLFFRAGKIKYVNKPYYKYCLRPNSILRTDFDEKNLQIIDIFYIIYERVNKLSISNDDKEKAMYMIYTRRFYEFLLENISKEKFINRIKLLKIFCKKIYSLNRIMNKNKYFKKNVYYIQSTKKRLCNKILHFFINNKFYLLISIVLNRRLYYKFFHIQYKSIDLMEVRDEGKNCSINTML